SSTPPATDSHRWRSVSIAGSIEGPRPASMPTAQSNESSRQHVMTNNDARKLTTPLSVEAVNELRAGDLVELHGEVILCAGMTTHQRIIEHIERATPLPIDITGAALLHLGSYSEESDGGFAIRYINPTTSTRFNDLMPTIIRSHGLRLVGGKGGLDAESVAAMRETGCVYLSFLGGGCTLLS